MRDVAVAGLCVAVVGCGRFRYDRTPEATADGGGDARRPQEDAGARDSGRTDGGSADAGGIDAAPALDGGPMDGGPVDGGPTVPDAATAPDTGPTVDGGPRTCPGAAVHPCPDEVRVISRGGSATVVAGTDGLTDDMAGSCGGAGAGEYVVQIEVGFGFYNISTAGSDFDTVLYVREDTCGGPEMDCRDAARGTGGESFRLGVAHAGLYEVVVDGAPGQCGTIRLQIDG